MGCTLHEAWHTSDGGNKMDPMLPLLQVDYMKLEDGWSIESIVYCGMKLLLHALP